MYPLVKRLSDLLLAFAIFIILIPLFLIVISLQLLFNNGIVFYRQERIGKGEKHFEMFKFATMHPNSMNMGSKTVTLRNDPRVTPLGRFLRISKINELPQLFNIVKGDMSFIGPRPLIPASFRKYNDEAQAAIAKCYPGLSGVGSVVFRDEEELVSKVRELGLDPMAYYQDFIYPYKGKVEIWYSKNQSFRIDLQLMILTLWIILYPESNIIHKIFSTLAPKPMELTAKGIQKNMLTKNQSR